MQITAALLKADLALSANELAGELGVEQERLRRLQYDDGGGTAAPSVAAAFGTSGPSAVSVVPLAGNQGPLGRDPRKQVGRNVTNVTYVGDVRTSKEMINIRYRALMSDIAFGQQAYEPL